MLDVDKKRIGQLLARNSADTHTNMAVMAAIEIAESVLNSGDCTDFVREYGSIATGILRETGSPRDTTYKIGQHLPRYLLCAQCQAKLTDANTNIIENADGKFVSGPFCDDCAKTRIRSN